MEFLKLNKLNSIQQCNLEMKQLNILKNIYLKKINTINNSIQEIENHKYQLCGNQGHEWAVENEDGMCGEQFIVCKNCGLF